MNLLCIYIYIYLILFNYSKQFMIERHILFVFSAKPGFSKYNTVQFSLL